MHDSRENISTNELECQPLSSYTPEQVNNLIRSLTETSPELHRDGKLLEWQGVDFLRNIIKHKQSCIVVGGEDTGRGCAAKLCEDDLDDSLIVIAYPTDIHQVYKQLWLWLEKPLPFINEHSIALDSTCFQCKLDCLVKRKKEFLWDDPFEVEATIGPKGGKCLMLKHLVNRNLFRLYRKTVILKIPDLDSDLLTLLGELLEATTVIILSTPEQKKKLDKQQRFRQLPSWFFPKATSEFLLKILNSKVKGTGMNRSPFNLDAALLVSALSHQNPGEFNRILARVLNQAVLEGRAEQIDIGYALEVIMGSLDDKARVVIALYETEFKIDRPGELASIIKRRFGVSMQARGIGEILRSLGYQPRGAGRDSKGRRYRITKPTIPLLGTGITNTREVLPESDSEQ